MKMIQLVILFRVKHTQQVLKLLMWIFNTYFQSFQILVFHIAERFRIGACQDSLDEGGEAFVRGQNLSRPIQTGGRYLFRLLRMFEVEPDFVEKIGFTIELNIVRAGDQVGIARYFLRHNKASAGQVQLQPGLERDLRFDVRIQQNLRLMNVGNQVTPEDSVHDVQKVEVMFQPAE
jgi:hypothetical protein